jgi:hypothetical protein
MQSLLRTGKPARAVELDMTERMRGVSEKKLVHPIACGNKSADGTGGNYRDTQNCEYRLASGQVMAVSP